MRAFFLIALMSASSAFALDIDWKTYFRGPVGTNASGGKQIPLTNPGSRGNEFRLGNETAYGEAYFWGHILKPSSDDSPYFDFNLTVSYNPAMNSQYGDSTSSGDPVSIVQGYAEGGNLDGIHASYWAGKRFYRNVDVHMDDFYYFADMSGVGAGVEKVNLLGGHFAVAYLQHSDNSSFQNAQNGLKQTTNGVPSKQALDVRLFDVPLTTDDHLHFWAAYGYTAPGTGLLIKDNSVVDYSAGSGAIGAVRWSHSLGEKQFNNLAAMYGTGVLENFNMENSYINPGSLGMSKTFVPNGSQLNGRKRWRIVDNPVIEFGETFAIAAAAIYEEADNGTGVDAKSRWMSLGVRPIYYFTEHFHLAVEAGYSDVKFDNEKNGDGSKAGDRTLMRLTVAPEIAMGRGFFNRPVIRAYVTETWWNSANADVGNPNSLLGQLNQTGQTPNFPNTALNGKRSETQVGFEAEVWF